MNKITGLTGFKFLGFKRPRNIKSVTLVELMISIIVVATMVLSFYSLETYGHLQIINADRRAKVQNNLAYCMEYMSKYVQQANGDVNNPPIKLYPNPISPRGFEVRVDCQVTQTPLDLTDDVWVYYALTGNNLRSGCRGAGCGSCSSVRPVFVPAEILSNKIVANFNNSVLPVIPLYGASDGFYVVVDPLGNFVDVGLVGRYDPSQVPTLATRLTNPQVELKTRLICNNASTN
ncbi:MAG: hypothetical protein Q8N62_02380 [Candidatus Omnitrophota bacterium]|nr:hypothetical protein [Candidatus Omnitrophota bacterium]